MRSSFRKKERSRRDSGQVAVEFLMMFILAAGLILYIFYFSLSLSVLQYKQYITYMVGRAITSSSPSYSIKSKRANQVLALYNSTDSSKLTVATTVSCPPINDPTTGFRNLLEYWGSDARAGKPRYDFYSTAGIACSVELTDVLPGILLGKEKSLLTAIESMTGTEMSDGHCRCLLDFNKRWEECLAEGGGGTGYALIDNGC